MQAWEKAAVLGVCLAALAVLAGQPAVNADVTWHLVAARPLRGGAELYRDIRDPNLPPVFGLAWLCAWLEARSGLPPHRWYFIATALWLALALLACRLPARGRDGLLLAGLALLFTLLPGLHAGQRDHWAAAGLLPYLLGTAREPQRASLPAAALLAVALLLKPYYLLVLPLVEAGRCALLRAGPARWSWRAHGTPLAALLLFALALAALLWCWPDYLDYVRRFGRLYADLPAVPLDWLAWAAILLLPASAVLAAKAGDRRSLFLLLGGAGALLVTAVQAKWWDYHLLAPLLLLAAGSWAALLAPAARHRLLRGGLALLVVGWAALAGWRAFSIHHLGPGEGRAPFIRTLAGWIEGAGAPARVAILSGHVVDYMPAVYLGGGAWSLPDPSLWQLAAFGQRGAAAATERARFLDELLDGLLQAPPALLGLQAQPGRTPADPALTFAAQPRFLLLLARYRFLGVLRSTAYWQLR